MSHEIRTPMNAILGFSQLMLREPGLSLRQREQLASINRSGEHLLSLINDILELSKIEAGHVNINRTTFDVRAMLDDITAMFRVRTDARQLGLSVEPAKDVPRFIVTDQGKLRQILINLLGNAVKFTTGGKISLRVMVERDENKRLILKMEVEDTGQGIAEKDLLRIFNMFEQSEAGLSAGGTGLGLALTRQFSRLLGGDVGVKSRPGEGSCFFFRIAVEEGVEPPGGEKIKKRIAGLKPGGKKPMILIVDDNRESRVFLRELLSITGFLTAEAENGREAIAGFKKDRPNLVLMDLNMSVMDGRQACKIIKKMTEGRDVPVIAVTAAAFTESGEEPLSAVFDGIIVKPFREQELFDVLESRLGVEYVYEEEASSGQPDQDAPGVASKMPEILIVDDTPENLDVLIGILEKAGYTLRPVRSGEAALRAARENPPDLILLDINMPGMDGYEVCGLLKDSNRLKQIPVIFSSASDEAFDRAKAFSAGAVDYITKPFRFEDVLARVKHHLANK